MFFFETVKQQQQSIETKNQYPNSNESLNHEKKKKGRKKNRFKPQISYKISNFFRSL